MTDRIFMKILPEMYLWLKFGSHPDLDPDLAFLKDFFPIIGYEKFIIFC